MLDSVLCLTLDCEIHSQIQSRIRPQDDPRDGPLCESGDESWGVCRSDSSGESVGNLLIHLEIHCRAHCLGHPRSESWYESGGERGGESGVQSRIQYGGHSQSDSEVESGSVPLCEEPGCREVAETSLTSDANATNQEASCARCDVGNFRWSEEKRDEFSSDWNAQVGHGRDS